MTFLRCGWPCLVWCILLLAGAGGACGTAALDEGSPDLSMPVMPAGCSNHNVDGDETDVDCGGGVCPPCAPGKACKHGSDCSSALCVNQMCTFPDCADGFRNGDETDADCGGSCKPCPTGKMCNRGEDCASATCVNNVCGTSPCENGRLDGMETDSDCGGPQCPQCADGKMCLMGMDCAGGICAANVCRSPLMCPPGTANCDGMMASGCNVMTDRDARNCGACGTVCPKETPGCLKGVCVVSRCPNGVTFDPYVKYGMGTTQGILAAADVTRDGQVDLVIPEIEFNKRAINVLVNQAGTFNKIISTPESDQIDRVTLRDLDGDGEVDLVATVAAGDVGVFFGMGGAQFAPAVHFGGQFFALDAIAVSDVTRDGKLDLVTCEANNTSVGVMAALGGRLFDPLIRYQAGGARDVVAGDLNGDGKPDLAVCYDHVVSVLLNTNNGQFPKHDDYQLVHSGVSTLIADFNSDGKPDLATSESGGKFISVVYNQGNGTFGAENAYMAGPNVRWIVSADFNLDGKPDIAALNSTKDQQLTILLNQGGAKFGAPLPFKMESQSSSLVAADFDGDGRPDIASGNPSSVSVLLNRCF